MNAIIECHGDVYTIEPVGERALRWVRENTCVPGWAWVGPSFTVFPAAMRPLLQALNRAGFELVERQWNITPHAGERGQA